MKRIISLLTVAIFAMIALPATAFDQKALTVPIVAAGAISNGIGQTIYVGAQNNVGIEWTTAATNVTARYSASVSGSRWMTNYYVITHRDTATAGTATTVTNLDVKGLQYLRLDSVSVPGNVIGTNTVNYSSKPGL